MKQPTSQQQIMAGLRTSLSQPRALALFYAFSRLHNGYRDELIDVLADAVTKGLTLVIVDVTLPKAQESHCVDPTQDVADLVRYHTNAFVREISDKIRDACTEPASQDEALARLLQAYRPTEEHWSVLLDSQLFALFSAEPGSPMKHFCAWQFSDHYPDIRMREDLRFMHMMNLSRWAVAPWNQQQPIPLT